MIAAIFLRIASVLLSLSLTSYVSPNRLLPHTPQVILLSRPPATRVIRQDFFRASAHGLHISTLI